MKSKALNLIKLSLKIADTEEESNKNGCQMTCLLPEEPGASLIINTSDKVLKKQLKKGGTVYEIAPGECKLPTNWLAEKNFDVTAFPEKFPDGKYGFHYKREIELSPHKYFSQRILNTDV